MERNEGCLTLFGMQFPKLPRRYYQQRRNKRSSGSAEWHSRTEKQRRVQRTIAAYTPDGWENWCHFIRRMGRELA